MGILKLTNTVRMLHRATPGARLGVPLLILTLSFHALAGTKARVPRVTGTEYYIVFPKAAYSNPNVGVLLNCPAAQTVTISERGQTNHLLSIAQPRTSQYVGGFFPIVNTPEVVLKSAATHIQSTGAMGVVAQYGLGGISGTYTPLSVSSWGSEYFALAPPEGENSTYSGYPVIYSVPMITIIGSHAGTTITITPTAPTAMGRTRGVPFDILLNAGDVYNITTLGDPQAPNRLEGSCMNDLSGTHIQSSWPVGVIVSQSHSSLPCGNNDCGDYCVEWLPPVCNWDSLYVVVPSVQRLNDAAGDQIEIAFGYDHTDLTVDDGLSEPRVVGTFNAGDVFEYPRAMSSSIILKGSMPFLIADYTLNARVCGSEPWTLSMNIISGVNQWSNIVPFSTAWGSTAIANLVFRYRDAHLLKLNGKPMLTLFPIMNHLPEGYAMVPIGLVDGYCEITGDSGATAGGTIYGYGKNTPGNAQSFSHPISGNCTAKCNPDVTPPHASILFGYQWTITALDDELNPPATGIYDVWLGNDGPSDTSYNVFFKTAPAFNLGDSRSNTFTIAIRNLLKNAQATLHLLDGAGNEYDTVLIYRGKQVEVRPDVFYAGAMRANDSVANYFTVINHGSGSAFLNTARLQLNTHWHLVSDVLALPHEIRVGDSLHLYVSYHNDSTSTYQCDADTLLLGFDMETQVASMEACNIRPAISAVDHDFGMHYTNLGPRDTANADIIVINTGSDTLHVTGATLRDNSTPASDSDFWIASRPPMPSQPWILAPGDSARLTVTAFPRYEGIRSGYIYFNSDAQHVADDTSWLQVSGYKIPVSVNQPKEIPKMSLLAENYPNPFTDATTIAFDAPQGNYVVAIFNSIGEKVGEVEAVRGGDGKYAVRWNAGSMPGGMYYYRVGLLKVSGKFMVVK